MNDAIWQNMDRDTKRRYLALDLALQSHYSVMPPFVICPEDVLVTARKFYKDFLAGEGS